MTRFVLIGKKTGQQEKRHWIPKVSLFLNTYDDMAADL